MNFLLTNPDYLVLLLLAGILLLYTEFNVPGTVLPGALGALCTMLALFGLSRLPVSPAAVALLVVGLAVMLLELKAPTHGLLAFTGTALLIWGLLHLILGPTPIHPAVAIAAGLTFAAITCWLAWIALLARRNKSLLGPQAMLGKLAIARTPLNPSGQVEIRGELWQATLTGTPSALPGTTLIVDSVTGLHLQVHRAE